MRNRQVIYAQFLRVSFREDPFRGTNHEAPNGKPAGINALYSDGHVNWMSKPWDSENPDRFLGAWWALS